MRVKGTGVKSLGVVAVVVTMAALAWLGRPPEPWAQSAAGRLVAVRVSAPPALDGAAQEAAWAQAPALAIPVSGGAMGEVTVTMKAVYTATEIYVVAQWPDTTETIEHHPFTFDGQKWTKVDQPLEDRFAIQWNISVPDFAREGCAVLCHSGDGYPDKMARMHTGAPGEFTDEWHWKAARSNPMGYVDDKYLDNAVEPGNDEVAHHADGGVRVYKGNKLKDGVPEAAWKGAPGTPPVADAAKARLFLLAADAGAVPPANPVTGKAWARGDTVPVAVLQPPTGSNADIKVYGRWVNGVWTLEMSRALDPGANAVKAGKKIDVVFEPGKTYHFGVAVFDNAEAGDHSFSDVLTLVFR